MRKIIGLIIFSMAIPGFGVELYIQDFSTGSWPAGYTFEGNWQIGTNWDGNDTPPAAIYNWTPRQTNFEHNMTTDYIDVGENDGVLIKFDFALDFYDEDELNGLMISLTMPLDLMQEMWMFQGELNPLRLILNRVQIFRSDGQHMVMTRGRLMDGS